MALRQRFIVTCIFCFKILTSSYFRPVVRTKRSH